MQIFAKNTKTNDSVKQPIEYNIDFAVIYKEKYLLIKGWAFDTVGNPVETIQLLNATGDKGKVFFEKRIERKDVHRKFSLKSEKKLGFILISCFSGTAPKKLRLESQGQYIEHVLSSTASNLKDFEAAFHYEHMSITTMRLLLLRLLGDSYLEDILTESKELKAHESNFHLDCLVSLEQGVYLDGWLDNYQKFLSGIYFYSQGEVSDDVLDLVSYYERNDVIAAVPHLPANYEAGIYGYIPFKASQENFYVILISKPGIFCVRKISAEKACGNEVYITQLIFKNLIPRSKYFLTELEKHAAQCLHQVWHKAISPPERAEVEITSYGSQPKNPICSIIIPLYGRYDFVLHQLSQFVNDDGMKNVELIYVLDDPRIEQELKQLCLDSSHLFKRSFKLVNSGKNLGYAGANNLGVDYANSRMLLLLNSDVLPSEAGWVQRMLDAYHAEEEMGALGVKLVFEDETIQHMGISFERGEEFGGLWLNEHPNKGLPDRMLTHAGCTAITAVTAACLMVSKEKFEEVDGFSTKYILGDFEDSDLCLKLREKGYQNFILGSEKLYHLERQSQSLVNPGDWKFKMTLFNAWQHDRKWGSIITKLKEKGNE